MAFKKKNGRKCSVLLLLIFLWMTEAKLSQDNKTHLPETKSTPKLSDGAALVFADEFKITLERYLFGICPQSFKMAVTVKGKNTTTVTCDLDTDQQDLAGRLATLALRAHSAVRSDCSRFGAALANTLGELARTAANRHAMSAAVNEANKKRKLSKSQKAKIQAKQRTALAVKKKAAAAAAAAAAKMAS
ncbi:PREDICTED: uncharacterized protein LOC106122776 isoform X4 [Papilio xuthus]|uniref:Uncharacterized protein LOC106122776 isoform X4 n=1 Tax=Papilio xuthus TaxID=66420 RepID=A0AAJ6ZK84_PAPXU|nr:PREDICTED: uncharacterized protein LOC106122776 isoform X4 [Papilio xuthus]